MNRREFIRLLGAFSGGGLLSGSLMSPSAWAQSRPRTRTRFINLEARDHFELGRAYAMSMPDVIADRLRKLKGAGVSGACYRMLAKCEQIVRVQAPEEYDEIRGMTRVLRVKPVDILLMGLLLPIWKLVEFPGSTVAVGPARSTDSKTRLALNVDYALEHAPFGVVVRRKLRDRPTTLTWSLAGGFGLAGINSAGLGITAVWLKFDGEAMAPGVPAELIIRQALLQKNFGGALALLADPQVAVASASSFAVLLADSKGKMALVERTTEHFSGHKPGQQWLVHTNHFMDRGLARDDLGKKVFPDTTARFRTLRESISRRRQVTPEYLKALMTNHDGNPKGICRHDENHKTIASMLLCPNDGTLTVARGNPCTSKWETFRLDTKVRGAK